MFCLWSRVFELGWKNLRAVLCSWWTVKLCNYVTTQPYLFIYVSATAIAFFGSLLTVCSLLYVIGCISVSLCSSSWFSPWIYSRDIDELLFGCITGQQKFWGLRPGWAATELAVGRISSINFQVCTIFFKLRHKMSQCYWTSNRTGQVSTSVRANLCRLSVCLAWNNCSSWAAFNVKTGEPPRAGSMQLVGRIWTLPTLGW